MLCYWLDCECLESVDVDDLSSNLWCESILTTLTRNTSLEKITSKCLKFREIAFDKSSFNTVNRFGRTEFLQLFWEMISSSMQKTLNYTRPCIYVLHSSYNTDVGTSRATPWEKCCPTRLQTVSVINRPNICKQHVKIVNEWMVCIPGLHIRLSDMASSRLFC